MSYTLRFRVLIVLILSIFTSLGFNISFYLKQYTKSRIDPVISLSSSQELLNETRSKIRELVFLYNVKPFSDYRLEDFVIETGGRPLRSIIISTWNSGGTYLGPILNSVPGTYYHFEPLSFYGMQRVRSLKANETLTIIKNLLNCNYGSLKEYWDYGNKNLNFYRKNKRLWKHCKKDKKLCADVSFMSQFCKLFPLQAMKIDWLRLSLMRDLLRDKDLNARAILLVRDPRGVMLSMRYHNFCNNSEECVTEPVICADMISDYEAASQIMMKNSERLMVVRYEELAMKPFITVHEMFKFLKISEIKLLDDFLEWMAQLEFPGESPIYSHLLGDPFEWKGMFNFSEVQNIQMACKNAMHLWGYNLAHNETHLKSEDFNPIGNIFTQNWNLYVTRQRSNLEWEDYSKEEK